MSTDILIEFSNEDILRGKLVEPAWYRMKIGDTKTAMSKDGQSTNYEVEMTIIKNADNGNEEFTGVPVSARFNSKAKGFMVGYFAALGIEVGPGRPFNLGASMGREIDAFVERNEFEGKLSNRINHKYRVAA